MISISPHRRVHIMTKDTILAYIDNMILECSKHKPNESNFFVEVARIPKELVQFLFSDELYRLIDIRMKEPNAKRDIFNFYDSIINNLNDSLSSIGPIVRPQIPTKVKQEMIINITKLTWYEFVQMMEKTLVEPGKLNLELKTYLNNPTYLALTGMLRYASINNYSREEITKCIYMVGIILYPSSFYKSFPYNPSKNVMEYTINRLPNSYIIRKLGSMGKLLLYNSQTAYAIHEPRFKTNGDWEYINYLNRVRTSISANIIKIAGKFYEDVKKGNRIDHNDSIGEIDGKIGAQIEEHINKIMHAMITYGVNHQIIGQVAHTYSISPMTLEGMYSDCLVMRDKYRDYISAIITRYFLENAKDNPSLKSKHFVNWAKDLHKKTSHEVYKKLNLIVNQLNFNVRFLRKRTAYTYIVAIHRVTLIIILNYA